ncbi:zinc finger protein 1035 isoform X2 [Thalassophryne amazonica]|nr:zinc finger protein 1035 isoform X2 [Thalassophryne amazonica]
MAHGWDSYFAHIPSVSSDSNTLRRLSDSEGSTSHLENFVGHDFTTGALPEPPATNSNFQTNFYSNPGDGVSRSDCVYQKCCKDTTWKTEGEHMRKEDAVSEFTTDGLSTTETFPSSFSTNLHQLKQDDGTLSSSYLGDYSDVSSSSEADVSETRPSCKFMTSNSVSNSTSVGGVKQSASEWLFTPTGHMTISTKRQCHNARLFLPSNVKEAETMDERAQNKMEKLEKSTGNYTSHQSSETLNMLTTTGSESVEDCNDCDEYRKEIQEDAEVEQSFTEEKTRDTSISILISTETQEYPGSNMEEQNIFSSNIMTTFDSLDQDNLNRKAMGYEKGNCGDQNDLALDKQKTTAPNLTNCKDDNCRKVVEAKEKILNDTKESSKQNEGDVQQTQNTTFQHDHDENTEENQDKIIQSSSLHSSYVEHLNLSGSTDPAKKLKACASHLENSEDGKSHLDMPENRLLKIKNNCGSLTVNLNSLDTSTNNSNELSHLESYIQSNCSSPDGTQCLEKQMSNPSEETKMTSPNPDCTSVAVSSVSHLIDKSDNRGHVHINLQSCLQGNGLNKNIVCPENEQTSKAEETDETFSSGHDCSDLVMDNASVSNKKSVCSNSELCLQENSSSTPLKQCLKKQLHSLETKSQSLGSSPDLGCSSHSIPIQCNDNGDNKDQTDLTHLESVLRPSRPEALLKRSPEKLCSLDLEKTDVASSKQACSDSVTTCDSNVISTNDNNENSGNHFSLEKTMSNSAFKTSTDSLNRDCGSTVLPLDDQCIDTGDGNEENIYSHKETSLLPQTQRNPCLENAIDGNGNNKQDVCAHSKCCLPLSGLEINKNTPVEMEWRSPVEETDKALSDVNCSGTARSHGHIVVPGEDNKHHASAPVKSSIHSDILRTDTSPSPEKERTNSSGRTNTSSPYMDQSLQKNPVDTLPEPLSGDVTENAKVPLRELDTAKECSLEGMPYVDPLSEQRFCNNGETEFKHQCEDLSLIRQGSDAISCLKQVPELQSSVYTRRVLQPIVILDALKPAQTPNSLYNCAVCQHTANSINDLIEHLCSSHLVHNFVFCRTCNTFLMKNQHTEEHVCGATESSLHSKSDLRNKPKPRLHSKCNRCGITFSKVESYVKHMWTHSGKTPFKCQGCGLYFSKKGGLTKHTYTPGRCKRPVCENKDANPAASRSVVKRPPRMDLLPNGPRAGLPECSVKLVDLNKNNLCVCCNKAFSTVEQTKKHYYNVHKEKMGTFVLSQSTQKAAVETCPEVKSGSRATYDCILCHRAFKYSYNRARHLRECVRNIIWGGQGKLGNKFQCPLCKALFTFKSSRCRHINGFCLKKCLALLSKERAAKLKPHMEKKTFKTEHAKQCETQSKETDGTVQKTVPSSIPAHPFVPRYKSALLKYSSGKSRHMKISHSSSVAVLKTKKRKDSFTSDESNTSRTYSCRFCGKCFERPLSLQKHELTHKGERPYSCPKCNKAFKKHRHLITHQSIHQRRIQCTVCNKILPTIEGLLQHQNAHVKKGMLQCPDCPMQFEIPAYLLKHILTHSNKLGETNEEAEMLALEKKQTAVTQLSSTTEVQEQNVAEQVQCSLCKVVFDDAQVLRKHCLTHISVSSALECPFCKRNFSIRRNLVRHMFKHTGGKPFSCSICGKQFYSEYHLKCHMEKCISRFPKYVANQSVTKIGLRCPHCPRVFFRKPRFKIHLKGHLEKYLKACLNCGQCFTTPKLTMHLKLCKRTKGLSKGSSVKGDCHKAVSPTTNTVAKVSFQASATIMLKHKCQHCAKRFKYRSLLYRHLSSHRGAKSHACMHCGHIYSSQAMCFQHEAFCDGVYRAEQSKDEHDAAQQSNTSEPKPQAETDAKFKCKFCTKAFMKARSLRSHILTHTEAKPYRCKVCNSCFSRYDHLKVHETHCSGTRTRLEIRIPRISLDDVGKGWLTRHYNQSAQIQQSFECTVCLKHFNAESTLSRHILLFHAAKKFTCDCGASYTHEKSLRAHKKSKKCKKVTITRQNSLPVKTAPPKETAKEQVHSKRNQILRKIQPKVVTKYQFSCDYCQRAFGNAYHLKVHVRLHTGEMPYACEYCDMRFIRKDYVQRHYEKCTKIKSLNSQVLCDRCGGFFTQQVLETHRKTCSLKPSSTESANPPKQQTSPKSLGFSCAFCSSRFLLFSQLQEHFITNHKPETSMKPPVTTAPLQQHLANIPQIKKEPLDEQSSDTGSIQCNLDSFLELDTSKPLGCTQCKMRFVNKAGLVGHLRVHSNEYPFSCKRCKRGFWNKNLLRNHYRKCGKDGNVFGINSEPELATPLKADMDLVLNSSASLSEEEPKTTDAGVLETNISCTEILPENSDVNQEQSKEEKTVQYQCSECDKTFTDGLMLISHLEDHGREEQEKRCSTCTKCGRVCSSPGHLEKHMKVHSSEKISCPYCPKIFLTSADLERHKSCHDASKAYKCKICHLRFPKKPSLTKHYLEDHPNNLFKCPFCEKAYAIRRSLARHCKVRHPKKVTQNLMERVADEKKSTVQIPTTQVSETSDTSEDCNSDTNSNEDVAPYFPCHVCGKTFLTSESLEDHQRCHLGEKPHECAECGKCFFQAAQLQQHQRMHKSEFQCPMCGRGFVSLFALRKHKHTHGKRSPYRCSNCQVSFTGPSQLAEHMLTHREESFPCDICNQIFFSKSSRAEHRKSHPESRDSPPALISPQTHEKSDFSASSPVFSSEFKYRCGVCNERFRDPEELSEHGCLAAGERPYTCSQCDEHFLHRSHLKKHINIRHLLSSNGYPCNQCINSFASPQQFLSHLKNHEFSTKTRDEIENEKKNPTSVFICPVCHQCYPHASALAIHFPQHGDPFECKDCKMQFTSRRKLEEHQRCHLTALNRLQCQRCGQNFLGDLAFQKHNCTSQQNVQMERQPSYPSANTTSVKHGRQVGEEEDVDVTGEDLYNCPTCSVQFSSKSSLLDHQNKMHPLEFKCQFCGKTFALRRHLKDHERKRHLTLPTQNTPQVTESQFKCYKCPKIFDSSKALSLHLRRHAERDGGQHRCDMCYESFSQWALLKRHQESHVGQVVYECTECDKAFAFPHLLEAHQQTHAGSSH